MTRHIVALSGGKDSSAMSLRLRELEPDTPFEYVCTPTGNELPEMFEHWRRLGDALGSRITPIMGGTLDGLIGQYNALPNWRQRWCTRRLKIEPFAAYLATLVSEGPVVAYVGLRADEQEREGGNYSGVGGATLRYPMRDWGWGIADVTGYLADRGIAIPTRTDCAVCFFQRLGEWYWLWRDNPAEYAKGEAWEAQTGYTFRSPGRDTQPASLQGLREKFETGYVPRGVDGTLLRAATCRVCSL